MQNVIENIPERGKSTQKDTEAQWQGGGGGARQLELSLARTDRHLMQV